MSSSLGGGGSAALVCAAVAAARDGLAGLAQVLYQVPSGDLQAVLGQLRELAGWADAASVSVVSEAWSRGVIGPSSRGLVSTGAVIECIQASAAVGGETQRAAEHHPAAADDDSRAAHGGGHTGRAVQPVDRGTACRLARLAQAAHGRGRQQLVDAVCTARVNLVAGLVALTEFDKLEPRLVQDVKGEALGWFTQVAASNDTGQVRALRPAIIAGYGADGELERSHQRAQVERGFTSPVPVDGCGGDGLCQYTLLADAQSVALIEAAIG